MTNKIKIICLSLFTLISAANVYAQESMTQDVNYPYLEKLIAAAKANYPEVKVKEHQVNIANGTLHSASFSWLDAFTANYIYSPQSSINLAQPTIYKGYQLVGSLNLGMLFEKPFTVHNAREAVKVAEYQKQEYELNLTAQVKRFYFAYIKAQAELRERVHSVSDAETAASQLKHSFQKNEVTFQVYNESMNNLYSQRSFKIQAESEVLIAKTNLEELLGATLESIK